MTSLASETSAEPKPRAEPPAATDGPLYGSQRPRLLTLPGVSLSSAGQEAVDLAERAGLKLDSWQRFVLDKGMSERADGNWAAPEVCVNVPRQNGKGAVIEARVLWGLFIGGEKQILLSAHEFKTTHNTMKRIERLIEGCPDLLKRVKQFHKTVGREGIELHDGRELKYIARSRGSGRGFTADCVIFDECMILGDDAMSALAPTADAVDNSQLWYLGSAGIGHLSQQMARLRKRCLTSLESGVPDPVLAYMEWSINQHRAECMPGCTEHDDIDSVQSLLRANPGVGYRLQVEKSMQRRLTMGDHLYARERLGVGEYPSDEADTWQVIGEDAWRSLAAAESAPEGEVVFAIDATPEQDHAAIAVAGRWRGGTHIEIAHHQPGMSWVVAKAKRMQEEHKPRCWVVDAGGPAGALIKELEEELGITVVSPKMREIAQAAGQFFNAVADQSLSHIDQPLLATALAGAQKRPLGEAWAWARRGVGVDISPLVAATNARWGLGVEVDSGDVVDNVW
ncbi:MULTISPECIES: terminase [Streptomyces]|uniref:terminase n=1 Tax=Streptomyces TaxID=1883 RepID=UPI00205BA253|nr:MULTISPECIES: terminase [Streptomyces]UPT41778.1 terminase [Streptomyces sp. WAC00303]WIY76010.1 terminase [Streptomyces anulatus]